MSKPLVAIVGRPNVGKSTLFNRLIGRRVSIVEDTPGVTRDRIYGDAEWLDYAFTLIDTGGIEPASEDQIAVQMRRQAELAIETADVILFLVDGREGMTSADVEVAAMLRKSKKPVVLGVNKIDAPKFEEAMYEFYSLGLGVPFLLSAVLIDYLKSAFGWIKAHYRAINLVCGGFLVLVGVLMATGLMGRLISLLS